MKRFDSNPFRRFDALLGAILLGIAAVGTTACSGDDGSTGPQGPSGPPGDGGTTSTEVEPGDDAPGIHVAILSVDGGSGAGGAFQVGDHVSFTFSVTKDDGSDWDLSELNYGRAMLSGPTFNYQRVLPEVTNVASTAVDNEDGTFTYTFASAIPARYPPPLNDSDAFDETDGELTDEDLLSGTYTLGVYFGWNYTVESDSYRDAGDAVQDVLFGSATTLDTREVVKQDNCNECHSSLRAHGALRRNVTLCLLCHTSGSEDRNTSALGGSPNVSIDFKVMIHKIHNGSHLPSVLGIATNDDGTLDYTADPAPYQVVGFGDSVLDFSDVAFPVWPNFNVAMPKDQGYSLLSSTDPDGTGPLLSPKVRNDRTRTGVTACYKCHGDPDGAGPLTAPANGDLFKTQPTERACYSCHDNVRPGYPYTANGQTMPDTANDSNCVLCHTTSGDSISVEDAHLHPLRDPTRNAGVVVSITDVTGGTGTDGNFQAGDTPAVTMTVQDDDGNDVGLASLDSFTAFFMGPTTNQQLIMPLTSATGLTVNPFDFTGRLHAVSTTNKGTMSKVFLGGTAVDETLTVQFTSATAFSVTGSASGSLGSGTLPASPSTYPSGMTITNFDLGSSLSTGNVTVTFSDSTHFTVSGAASGSGTLPASTNASTRFTSANLSFNIAVTSTAAVNGNAAYIGIFRGSVANPVGFAIVAGRTSFSATAGAPDRFYYEVRANASSYDVTIPMELPLEYLGAGSGAAGQTFTIGNSPVYYGRQQLWEAATTATTTTTSAAADAFAREVAVAGATGFAAGDTVVIEPAGAVGTREYTTITPLKADGTGAASGDTTTKLLFRTPLRYAHASGVSVTKVTLTFKQEGASNAYSLTSGTTTPGSASITSNAALTNGSGIVMTYRTDAHFGYRRDSGDTLQTTYVHVPNDTVETGEDQGDWAGLPYADGTYRVSLWGYKSIDVGLYGEVQTYRSTSPCADGYILYGAATDLEPHAIVDGTNTCLRCHDDILFHGGGRRGLDACVTCHSISGVTTSLTPGAGEPVEFRQMLHKIHMGEELPDADTYALAGEGAFPAMPEGVKNCVMCHGNESWHEPADREHPSASVPVRTWKFSCGSCHSSDAAQAHIDVQTSTAGLESCAVCHGDGRDWNVEAMHHPH